MWDFSDSAAVNHTINDSFNKHQVKYSKKISNIPSTNGSKNTVKDLESLLYIGAAT